jgi:hypothetical protein
VEVTERSGQQSAVSDQRHHVPHRPSTAPSPHRTHRRDRHHVILAAVMVGATAIDAN